MWRLRRLAARQNSAISAFLGQFAVNFPGPRRVLPSLCSRGSKIGQKIFAATLDIQVKSFTLYK
jgi:hypothetical protein